MIPPLLLEVAAAVSPDDAEYEVSEAPDETTFEMRWRLNGRDASIRVESALFTDMVNFGERMVRAELEHEARKVVAQLTWVDPYEGRTPWPHPSEADEESP